MAKCKECGLFAPQREKRGMCLNPKNRQGDFVMFVNPNEDNDRFYRCFVMPKMDGKGE